MRLTLLLSRCLLTFSALVEENISDAESTGASIPFENSDKKEEAEDAKDAAKNEMNGDDDDDQDDEGDDEEDVWVISSSNAQVCLPLTELGTSWKR